MFTELIAARFAKTEAYSLASAGYFVEVISCFCFGVLYEAVGLSKGVELFGGGRIQGVVVSMVESGHGVASI